MGGAYGQAGAPHRKVELVYLAPGRDSQMAGNSPGPSQVSE